LTGAIARYRGGGGGVTEYGGQSLGPFFTKYVKRKEVIFDACTGGCRDGIFKLPRSPGVDFARLNRLAGGKTSLFLLGS
jgi:hypothetical protein